MHGNAFENVVCEMVAILSWGDDNSDITAIKQSKTNQYDIL